MQILALDIGTDLLPAVALGAEPPRTHSLQPRRPHSHLLDTSVLFRSFGLFGPIEAMIAMAAFLATYAAAGWRFGSVFPSGSVFLAASGAAFTAVVLGQMGNALACRSTTRSLGKLGWLTNPLVLAAIAIELLTLVCFLSFRPLAQMLGHSLPSPIGLAIAGLALPAILAADWTHKHWNHRLSKNARKA